MNPNRLSDGDTRRYDIDWLRVLATYLLLLFHAGMVFNPAPFYHVRNTEVSFFFLILCGFIGLWHMPLFFLLAGWSAFASLSMRGAGEFLKERFFRLFVPLVAGCVLLMPSIKYLELSSGLDANYTGLYVAPALQDSFRQVIPSGLPVAAPFNESFYDFLPTFFTAPAAQAVLYGAFALGWVLLLLSTFLINHFDLFGLRQVWLQLIGKRYEPLPFQVTALYRYVRHPIYVGWLLIFWATPTMTLAHLVCALGTSVYILIAIRFEERNLVDAHPEYAEYRRRVPMLLPSLKPQHRIGQRAAAKI